jgi:hypothetical protein
MRHGLHAGTSALALAAGLALSAPAGATTLTNDPARPLPARQVVVVQRWLNSSAEPTPAAITVHRGVCPEGADAVACANVGYDPTAPKGQRWFESVGSMWFSSLSRRESTDHFDVLHETGHVVDAERYSDAERRTVERDLEMTGAWMPDARFWDGTTPPFERAADAYAMCSIHPRWPGTWWHCVRRGKDGAMRGGGSPTPYDFRAGRARYARICAAVAT